MVVGLSNSCGRPEPPISQSAGFYAGSPKPAKTSVTARRPVTPRLNCAQEGRSEPLMAAWHTPGNRPRWRGFCGLHAPEVLNRVYHHPGANRNQQDIARNAHVTMA